MARTRNNEATKARHIKAFLRYNEIIEEHRKLCETMGKVFTLSKKEVCDTVAEEKDYATWQTVFAIVSKLEKLSEKELSEYVKLI